MPPGGEGGLCCQGVRRSEDSCPPCTQPDAYDFALLPHEPYGRLGRPAMEHLSMLAMQHLSRLADILGRSGDFQRDLFVRNALRGLRVALWKGNATYSATGMPKLARGSGGVVWYRNARPVADT